MRGHRLYMYYHHYTGVHVPAGLSMPGAGYTLHVFCLGDMTLNPGVRIYHWIHILNNDNILFNLCCDNINASPAMNTE